MYAFIINIQSSKRNMFECPVCYTCKIDIFISDCGHVLCQQCHTNLNEEQSNQCVICRKNVRSFYKYKNSNSICLNCDSKPQFILNCNHKYCNSCCLHSNSKFFKYCKNCKRYSSVKLEIFN
jgi:hypothetical protein